MALGQWRHNTMVDIAIKDSTNTSPSGTDKIPVSDGSDSPRHVILSDVKDWIYNNSASDDVNFGGISFDGGTTILDVYEQGSFTPTLYGASTAGTTTYSDQVGSYLQIGNLVFWTLRLDWDNQTGSGDARIGGLPFSVKSGLQYRAAIDIVYYHSLGMPTGTMLTGYIDNGQNFIRLRVGESDTAATEATIADLTTSGDLYISGVHLID